MKNTQLIEFIYLLFVCAFSLLIFRMNSAHGILILFGVCLLIVSEYKIIFAGISEMTQKKPVLLKIIKSMTIVLLFSCGFIFFRFFSFNESEHKILVFSFGSLPEIFNKLTHGSAVYLYLPELTPFRWFLSFILPPALALIFFLCIKIRINFEL